MTAILLFFGGFVTGVFTLLGYMIWRLMRNAEWDDSNITNALRLLSHVVLHPNDFGKMHYISPHDLERIAEYLPARAEILKQKRPFWYVNKDELSEVVKSRPPK